MSKLTVVGAGAWGTALALQGLRAGHHVVLVARDAVTAASLLTHRRNPRLPGHQLPETLQIRHDVPDDADMVLWAVPTQQLRSSILRLQPIPGPVVICAKGVEVGSNLLPLEILGQIGPVPATAVLTGPNFAHEVALGLPTAAVVASADADVRKQVTAMLATTTFRLYGSDDPIGAQLGGAAKNVIAIAAGAVIGAGLGENARAALVTRGLNELRHLAVALGGRADTVIGLSGLGDLLLTCTGRQSRNFSLGEALGRGEYLPDILAKRSAVTEGVATAAALIVRAGSTNLPICRAVADLLAGRTTMDQAIGQLLSRPPRDE